MDMITLHTAIQPLHAHYVDEPFVSATRPIDGLLVDFRFSCGTNEIVCTSSPRFL